MSQTMTLEYEAHFCFRRRRRELRCGTSQPPMPPGRIPRLARLMALAIRLEELLREGVVASQAQLARLGRVSPARLTQIVSLLWLAPDIQEQILFLPPTQHGRDVLTERQVRPLLRTLLWREQRQAWSELKERAGLPAEGDGSGPGRHLSGGAKI